MMAKSKSSGGELVSEVGYGDLVARISDLLEESRRGAARAVNRILTATYWQVGCYIVEYEQGGEVRAEYGEGLWKRLAQDLTARHGRGFSKSNLAQMRSFYLGWKIFQTPSGIFEARAKSPRPLECETSDQRRTPSAKSQSKTIGASARPARKSPKAPPSPAEVVVANPDFPALLGAFPLSWSHYVRLMSVDKPHARAFYEAETIRGGWSVRQLTRQVGTQFFERVSASKRQEVMRNSAQTPNPEDVVRARDEIHDPYLLEFLELKDEYAESDLESAIIRHLESFLLELGFGFTFVARQKRIRVGDEWYRIDLLLYHRVLRCLVIIDLKTGPFTHADAGQMNLYLNYAREQLTLPGEQDPVGLILCSDKNDTVVKYATGGIRTQVFASKYLTELPDEETLRREILATQRALEHHTASRKGKP
jgi:predicted nuclease of restriction endonuclease-like (RecB) superfamily